MLGALTERVHRNAHACRALTFAEHVGLQVAAEPIGKRRPEAGGVGHWVLQANSGSHSHQVVGGDDVGLVNKREQQLGRHVQFVHNEQAHAVCPDLAHVDAERRAGRSNRRNLLVAQ